MERRPGESEAEYKKRRDRAAVTDAARRDLNARASIHERWATHDPSNPGNLASPLHPLNQSVQAESSAFTPSESSTSTSDSSSSGSSYSPPSDSGSSFSSTDTSGSSSFG